MKTISRYIMTLALLLTAATGAWADDFSTEAYTADATLSAVSVTGNTTLTINEGVTVTVNNGLTINSGATLTVTGGGNLIVNGSTGANGADGNYPGESGSTAIGGSGQLAIANATITATGGAGGKGGFDDYCSQFGGDGAPAVSGVSISIQTGSLTAIGGAGGIGGTSTVYHDKYPDGTTAKAFSSFPNISDATLSYSTDNVTYTKYESGNTTLYRYMKIEPLDGPAVTIADGNGEASFKMPQYDVTASYTLKRDMTVDVTATIDDRIRIKKDGNDYQPVGKKGDIDASAALPAVTDKLDTENPVTMTEGTDKDYTLTLQKQGDTEDDWTDVTAYSVGNFRYKITGTGNYSGVIYTDPFELFEGYEVTVPAGEFITYYKEEPLRLDEADRESIELYTVSSVSETTATLSGPYDAMPKNTPMFVRNKGTEDKTFYLIPCNDPDLALSVYSGFQGTLEPTTIAASTSTVNNYAFNGTAFVWVKNALEVGANKCWLSIGASSARTMNIVFDETTGISTTNFTNYTNSAGAWYSLDGRKLQGKPNRKGVYIKNGKKVVVK